MTEQTDPQPTGRAMTMREIREALGHNVTGSAKADDRDTLRERIVQALGTTPSALGAENPQLGFPSHHQPGESGYLGWCALCVRDIAALADAVMAVLPTPTDRAAEVCICGHTEQQHFEDVCITEITGCDCGDFLVPEAAREVIDRWQKAAEEHRLALSQALSLGTGAPWDAIHERVAELRRLAGEAQQDEEPDDTLHACPGRWGGPDCRCFDDEPACEAQQDPTQDGEEATPDDQAGLAAGLRAAADEIAGIDFHPNARARSLDIAAGLSRRLRRMADELQPTPAQDGECGAREPEPRTGTSPCVLPAGHGGTKHQDKWTNQWPIKLVARPGQPETDEGEELVHVGWWCWRGDNHGHLAIMACRSDNVPIHVPVEWADDMRAVLQRIEDGDDEPEPR